MMAQPRRSPRLAAAKQNAEAPPPQLGKESSFLRAQLAAMTSGAGHHTTRPRDTALQRLLMSLSSACYLGCAYTWHSFGYWRLGAWFWSVSAFSILADGLQDLIPMPFLRWARIVDRLVGTTGLVISVGLNCTSAPNAALSILATLSALCLLAKGRAIAKAEPQRRTKYLIVHGAWHVYGAAVLSAITLYVQGQTTT